MSVNLPDFSGSFLEILEGHFVFTEQILSTTSFEINFKCNAKSEKNSLRKF